MNYILVNVVGFSATVLPAAAAVAIPSVAAFLAAAALPAAALPAFLIISFGQLFTELCLYIMFKLKYFLILSTINVL